MQHRCAGALLPLSILLAALGCDDQPARPAASSPAPPGFGAAAALIDWSRPEFAGLAAALAEGDSQRAAAGLLAYYSETPPFAAPHGTSTNPIADADLLLGGVILLPPHPGVPLPADPTWLEDPLGDVNWRYQYHTLRWTQPLLAAYEATHEPSYLERLLFLLDDYMADNLVTEPISDMTWYDMAASLRSEHLLYFFRELLIEGEVDSERMSAFLTWMHRHGDALANEIHYNAASNHGTFHNRSLIVAGLGLPALLAAPAWLATGRNRLELQLSIMVSPYGVQVEQSPFYHFSLFSLSRSIRNILAQNGESYSAPTEALLARMPIFAAHILQPNGQPPMLSDTPADISATAYMGRHPVLDFSISRGAQGTHPGERFLSYPITGEVICRSGWGEARPFVDETMAVMDTGPLGGWHGHHDPLTVTLYSHGEALIVDSGYYTYNSDAWRSYFLSPAAHNVLRDANYPNFVADTPQRMLWRTGADWAYQSAIVELSPGCQWVRHFVYLDPGELLLLDFTYGGNPDPRLLLRFAPEAQCTQEGSRLRLSLGKAALDVFPAGTVPLELIQGQESPKQGWYSPRYGVRVPNLVASYGGNRRLEFMTCLHPHDGSDPLLDFRLLGGVANEYYRFALERSTGSEEITVWTAIGQVSRGPLAGR